jgi:trehalose 6-phosphate synthase
VLVVSHRGPFSFTSDGAGGFVAHRGAGGLVSAFTPVLDGSLPARWIAAALTDDDVAATRSGALHELAASVELLELDAEQHRLHYDVASNALLWLLHHDLFGLGEDPTFDAEAHAALDAYRAVNVRFADAVCDVAAPGDVVLVQDYQLALVPAAVRARRPDLRVQHFSHTPFCDPDRLAVLPDAFANDLVTSLAGGPAGFHTRRWATSFEACAAARRPGCAAATFVAPLGPDAEALKEQARAPEVATERHAIDELIGDRAVVMRADRIEPSKNIVRGFRAFDQLLQVRADLRGRVVFVAMLYPSRQSTPLYRSYADDVRRMAERVNERWSSGDWQPILFDERDSFPRTLAGYARADVVFVNPIKDGLNLVAKEAPLVNERDAVLCLSRGAGAYDELAPACEMLHPFDVDQQAAALGAALDLPRSERASRATALRRLAAAVTPSDWLRALLEHV